MLRVAKRKFWYKVLIEHEDKLFETVPWELTKNKDARHYVMLKLSSKFFLHEEVPLILYRKLLRS